MKIKAQKLLSKNTLAIIAGFISTSSMALAQNNNFVENARLPNDVQATCVADISPWFISRQVSENGWVNPANSLNPIFADSAHNTRCDFYKWGSQMFLWLTSGVGDQHVFTTTPGFYNISVKSGGKRTFETGNAPMRLVVRKGKTDTEIELGQAGNSDILLSQNEALVYYGIHANDVYALYTTQQKVAGGSTTEFPNTQEQLASVSEFAQSYGYPLGWDKMALAMELKTSWVDASKLADSSQYVLSKAVVPVFDRANKSGPWPVIYNQEVTLALVGMHVVGTVNSHPEMVWSTFEHVNNVPDNAYVYNVSNSSTKTQAYNSTGKDWNFLPEGAALPASIKANGVTQTASGSSLTTEIACVKDSSNQCLPDAISANDVARIDAFGNLHGSPAGSAAVANTTDLVSINVSVLSQLAAGDVRGNYIQTGGIWTVDGQIPAGGTDASLRGSLNLANTTMETYYQYPSPSFTPKNCFGCHGSTPSDATGISHVFDEIAALPKK